MTHFPRGVTPLVYWTFSSCLRGMFWGGGCRAPSCWSLISAHLSCSGSGHVGKGKLTTCHNDVFEKNTAFVSRGRDNFRKPHKIREHFVIWQSNTKLVSAPNWWSSITTLPCRCSWISSEARGHPRVCWESQVCWTGQSRNKLHYCTTGNYGLKSISIQQELHQ